MGSTFEKSTLEVSREKVQRKKLRVENVKGFEVYWFYSYKFFVLLNSMFLLMTVFLSIYETLIRVHFIIFQTVNGEDDTR